MRFSTKSAEIRFASSSRLTAVLGGDNLTFQFFQKVGEFMPEVIVRKGSRLIAL